MSVVRGYPNAGHFYSNIVKPIMISANWVVDSTNGNALGIRSLKSNGYVRNVFMLTTASFVGSTHSNTIIDGIPGGTASLMVGDIIAGSGIAFGTMITAITSSSAITIFPAASTTVAGGTITYHGFNNGYVNPNPLAGYAWVQFKSPFNYYLGGFSGFVSPVSGSPIAITGAGMTIGHPYIIASVGAVPKPSFTVTTVADVAGSLASTYFLATGPFGNNYVFYNVVSGVGIPPSLTGALANYIAVPVAFATGSSAATVATAVAVSMAAVNGGNSWTATALSNVVTVTSVGPPNNTFSPRPTAGTSGFTISAVIYTTLAADWQHVGVPPGVTPNVGVSFIALTTGGSLGSGTVISQGVSGITSVEVIGDPNQSIAPYPVDPFGGAWLLVQFLAATSSSVTTLIPTAPVNGTVVGFTSFFDGSGVTVDGL